MNHPSQHGALTTDLRAQLQSAVGATYTLERELGGGAVARVGCNRDALVPLALFTGVPAGIPWVA